MNHYYIYKLCIIYIQKKFKIIKTKYYDLNRHDGDYYLFVVNREGRKK